MCVVQSSYRVDFWRPFHYRKKKCEVVYGPDVKAAIKREIKSFPLIPKDEQA
jgi:hypothetical protein